MLSRVLYFLLCLSFPFSVYSNCDSLIGIADYSDISDCLDSHPDQFSALSVAKRFEITKLRIDKGLYVSALGGLLIMEDEVSVSEIRIDYARWAHLSGLCYYYLGDFPKSLKRYLESVQVYQSYDSLESMANLSLNVGAVYSKVNESASAVNFYFRALRLYSSLANEQGVANAYNNLGTYYQEKFDFDSAVVCFDSSLSLNMRIGNKKAIAAIYNNKGIVYDKKGDPLKAIENFRKSLFLNKQAEQESAVGDSYLQIGSFYNSTWEYDSALFYLQNARLIGEKLRSLDLLNDVYFQLYQTYKSQMQFSNALEALEKHKSIKEKISNEESVKQFAQLEMQYTFDQKQRLQQFLMDRQRILIYTSFFGLICALGVAGLLYRNYRIKQRDNEQLELKNTQIIKQRDEIAIQKKEITDSIYYASRIQRAVLPQEDMRMKYLPGHFIYYRPRDIVSGDFYWLAEKNGVVYFAAADCTGHGVPGAFMSLLGISFLNEIINDSRVEHPHQILSELRRKIITNLHQTGADGASKDGMDMTLVAYDRQHSRLTYSGAYNSLYLVRNGTVIEYKADKMPVGVYVRTDDFALVDVNYISGDMIYLASDGYADQFGGTNGKKLKSQAFKEHLVKASALPVSHQSKYLEDTFIEWMGSFEQIDDILIAGICIP